MSVRPLKYVSRPPNTREGHTESTKMYGTGLYYTNNNDFIIWRERVDGVQHWRCDINNDLRIATEIDGDKIPIVDMFNACDMDEARFQYRRDVVEALEQLYETLE